MFYNAFISALQEAVFPDSVKQDESPWPACSKQQTAKNFVSLKPRFTSWALASGFSGIPYGNQLKPTGFDISKVGSQNVYG
ncbi:hypothetical protein AJ80_07021 [Polytolypa hystricis UAMH7299]|uniref:Uncharacterized protein n=1 Tax=Polytolypa hystricis (strain UAMH7299) TaxID=1447883 RepID=A0A2B7XIU8_POLH7|nr:hypothetical protein AJ80_07021 [Polytolypa hystricis UAMH7299]